MNGRFWRRQITGVLLIGAIACAGPAPSADAPTPTVAASAPATTVTSEAVTTTAAVTSTTLSPDAAPAELAGTWKIDIGQGVTDRLTLRGNSYTWSFGAIGDISVNGDIIEFPTQPPSWSVQARGLIAGRSKGTS